MTERHTPGPWSLGNAANCGDGYAVCSGAFVVARVVGNGYPIGRGHAPDSDANARLIAAAPELLAALETLVRGRPTTPPNHAVLGKDSVAYMNWLAFEAARAAIARARGE